MACIKVWQPFNEIEFRPGERDTIETIFTHWLKDICRNTKKTYKIHIKMFAYVKDHKKPRIKKNGRHKTLASPGRLNSRHSEGYFPSQSPH